MMKNVANLGAIFLLVSATSALAQTDLCPAAGLTQPEFNFENETELLDRAAFEINARWTDGEWTALPVSDRLKRRDEAISAVYSKMRERRQAAYLSASCRIVSTKRCASTPGNRHVCPISVAAPPGTEFVPETLRNIDNDFDTGAHPTISPDRKSVSYAVKKTGRGANTAGFEAIVRFAPSDIKGWVDREVTRAQDYLSPLLRAELAALSGSVRIVPSSVGSSSCVADLERLANLRRSGDLSTDEFNSAKASLKCFDTGE